jgi:hypothetical protein
MSDVRAICLSPESSRSPEELILTILIVTCCVSVFKLTQNNSRLNSPSLANGNSVTVVCSTTLAEMHAFETVPCSVELAALSIKRSSDGTIVYLKF